MRWKQVRLAQSTRIAKPGIVPALRLLSQENVHRKMEPAKREITASAVISAPVGYATAPQALREIPARDGRHLTPPITASAGQSNRLESPAGWTKYASRDNAMGYWSKGYGSDSEGKPACGVSAYPRRSTLGRKATTATTTTSAPAGIVSALTTLMMAIPAKIG